MEHIPSRLRPADSVAFAERGFDGERVTHPLHRVQAPAAGADGLVEVMAVHFGPGQFTGVHRHNGGQILVVLDGTAVVEAGDRRVEAGPGDVVIAAPGEWHRHGAGGDGPMTHLAIHPQGEGLTETRPAEPAS